MSANSESSLSEALRARMQAGRPITVVNPDHPSPSLVEYLGRLAVDAVFIDCEQGSPEVETVENMARAARLAGVASLVRVFAPEDWVIERYLGRGVDGIVVPRLTSAVEAERVVAAVRYCFPAGYRDKLVVVQIETREALEGLAGFLGVAGIDVYFIGPVDLAKSLGYGGEYRHPEVGRAIDQAIATIRAAGANPGMLVGRDDAPAYVEKGVRFLYTHANAFLARGADDFARQIGAEGRAQPVSSGPRSGRCQGSPTARS